MNRQAAMIARLREAGGERITFNAPADVVAILDAIAQDVGVSRTDAIIAVIRKARERNPAIARAVAERR